MSGEQRIQRKGPTFTLVVGSEYDEDILDADHQRKGPDDKGESPEKVIVGGFRRECGRVDVERTCSNVAIDDSHGLIGKPSLVRQSQVMG